MTITPVSLWGSYNRNSPLITVCIFADLKVPLKVSIWEPVHSRGRVYSKRAPSKQTAAHLERPVLGAGFDALPDGPKQSANSTRHQIQVHAPVQARMHVCMQTYTQTVFTTSPPAATTTATATAAVAVAVAVAVAATATATATATTTTVLVLLLLLLLLLLPLLLLLYYY